MPTFYVGAYFPSITSDFTQLVTHDANFSMQCLLLRVHLHVDMLLSRTSSRPSSTHGPRLPQSPTSRNIIDILLRSSLHEGVKAFKILSQITQNIDYGQEAREP